MSPITHFGPLRIDRVVDRPLGAPKGPISLASTLLGSFVCTLPKAQDPGFRHPKWAISGVWPWMDLGRDPGSHHLEMSNLDHLGSRPRDPRFGMWSLETTEIWSKEPFGNVYSGAPMGTCTLSTEELLLVVSGPTCQMGRIWPFRGYGISGSRFDHPGIWIPDPWNWM